MPGRLIEQPDFANDGGPRLGPSFAWALCTARALDRRPHNSCKILAVSVKRNHPIHSRIPIEFAMAPERQPRICLSAQAGIRCPTRVWAALWLCARRTLPRPEWHGANSAPKPGPDSPWDASRLARYPYFCISINMLQIIFQASPERSNLLGILVAFVTCRPVRHACRTAWKGPE